MSKSNAVLITAIFALCGPLILWLGGFNFDERNPTIALIVFVWTAWTITLWAILKPSREQGAQP